MWRSSSVMRSKPAACALLSGSAWTAVAVAAIDGTLGLPTAEAYARIALEVVEAEAPDLVLVAYSSVGLDVAPDLALRCGLPLVSYVVSLTRAESRLSAVSQLYGGKVLASVDVDGRAVLMINPGAFPEAAAGAIDAGTDNYSRPERKPEGPEDRTAGRGPARSR